MLRPSGFLVLGWGDCCPFFSLVFNNIDLFRLQLHPGAVADSQLATAVVAFLKGQKDVTGPGL